MTTLAQSADPLEELKACARIGDAQARGACYEALGQRTLEQEAVAEPAQEQPAEEPATAAAPEPEPAPPAAPAAEPVATDRAEHDPAAATAAAATMAGSAATEPAAATPAAQDTATATTQSLPDDAGGVRFEESSTKKRYVGRVTDCSRAADQKWVFRLDSGQVWKQVSSRKVILNEDECQFGVTVSKDFFGYKMQIEGEKTKIRISRLQ
jgi:hypothetical protein